MSRWPIWDQLAPTLLMILRSVFVLNSPSVVVGRTLLYSAV
jgi:hypothetical protein